jgi:hypothetical protein
LSAFTTGAVTVACSGLDEQEARAIAARRMRFAFEFITGFKYT